MKPDTKTRCIALTLLFALAACTASFPLDRARTIGEFTHTAWGGRDGAPQRIWAITQTRDGYLWLGASAGLFRFDGVTFERYEPQSGPPLPPFARALLALSNGDLWIGFNGAISLLRNGRVETYTSPDGVPDGAVMGLVRDQDGIIWAGTTSGLARLEGNRWEEIGSKWNFSGKTVLALSVDRQGTLWVSAENAPLVFLPRGTTTFQSTSVRVAQVGQIVEAPNGKLWMAETSRSVRPIPLGTKLPPSDTVEIRVGSQGILFSREGALWITTLGDGIRHIPIPEQFRGTPDRFSSAVESFTTKDGLTDNFALSVFQDHDGDIWVGTTSGLDRFRIGGLVPATFPDWHPNPVLVPGVSGDIWAFLRGRIFHIGKSSTDEIKNPGHPTMLTAYREPGGVIWMISRETALVRFENGHISRFPLPKEFPKPILKSVRVTEDGSGLLWMAIEQQGLFRRENGTWNHFDLPPELVKLAPTAASTDDRGRAWFGYNDGTIIYLDGGKIQTVSTRQDSPVKNVGVIQGRNKHVWVGGVLGLTLFDEDKFHMVVPADRSSFDHVSGIEELADGSLWLCEQHGLIHIEAPEVRRYLEKPSYRVHYQVFDSLDGLPTTLHNSGQKLVQGTDGRIWVGGDHGIAWLSPAAIPASLPAPIFMRSIIVAGKRFAIQPDLTLPPRSQNLQVEYTAMNLSIPERVRYRYKLDGVDEDWQDAGVRREAFYTNLGPGTYKFHTSTRNEGGEWSMEAVLDFRIAPAWFQTIWFRAFCVCVFLFLLWMLYQLRLKQLERQFNMTLEARVGERTRIARELHDTLLQTFSASLLRFQSVSKMLPGRPEDAKQRVDNAIEQAANAIAEGRDAVHELRSGGGTANDLAQAIGNLGAELLSGPLRENPPEFHVQAEGMPRNLNPMVRDEAYRIAAEALRNAIRHAHARRIEVEIRYDEQQLRVRIRDDGKGLDTNVLDQGHTPGHWGLRGMRERARLLGGNLEVWSRSEAGSGTEIELTVPAASAYPKPPSRWTTLLRRLRH